MPSSVIAAMRYDAQRRVLMIVYQGNRGRYRYFDVPPEVWEAFRTASSKGTYLNETFKTHGYRYEKVPADGKEPAVHAGERSSWQR